jgi:hypothetical protein
MLDTQAPLIASAISALALFQRVVHATGWVKPGPTVVKGDAVPTRVLPGQRCGVTIRAESWPGSRCTRSRAEESPGSAEQDAG